MAKEVAESANSSGVFAMVMAVMGIVLPLAAFPLGFIGGIVCSVLGLVFGIIQVRKGHKGWAVSAIVFSVIGLVLNIAMILMLVAAVNSAVEQINSSGLLDDVRTAAQLADQYSAAGVSP